LINLATGSSRPSGKTGAFHTSRIKEFVFFLVLLATGLLHFQDYGVPYDESMCRYRGYVNLEEYNKLVHKTLLPHRSIPFGDLPDIQNFYNKDYGPFIELVLTGAEYIFNIHNGYQVYLLRHGLLFGLFWLACLCFYAILKRLTRTPWMPALGVILLFFTPRIFAHAAYNSKDTACLSLFIIALFTSLEFYRKPTLAFALLNGVAMALVISVRPPTLVLPFFLVIAVLVREFAWKNISARLIFQLVVMTVATCGAMICVWPFLWENPLQNFIAAIFGFSKFRWIGTVFFLGDDVDAAHLPWTYIPVSILVTIPPIVIAGLVLKLVQTARGANRLFRKKEMQNPIDLNEVLVTLLLVLLFLTPVLAVILMRSVLYDSWRQLQFIYAPMLLLVVLAFDQALIASNQTVRKILISTLVVAAAYNVYLTFRLHPYQNTYFNFLAGRGVRYDLDYWHLSYRQAIEFIKAHDHAPEIPIFDNADNLPENIILADKNEGRFTLTSDRTMAKYYVTALRGSSYSSEKFEKANHLRPDQAIYTITVDGRDIMRVYATDTYSLCNISHGEQGYLGPCESYRAVTLETANGARIYSNKEGRFTLKHTPNDTSDLILERRNDTYFLISRLNKKFVSADQGFVVIANRMATGPWEEFQLITNNDSTYSFKTNHGTYLSYSHDSISHFPTSLGKTEKFKIRDASIPVSFDEMPRPKICAPSPAPITFEMIQRDDSVSLFDTYHGKYITTEPDGSISLRSPRVGKWEKFYRAPSTGNNQTLTSWNNRYVFINNNVLSTTEQPDSIRGLFQFIPLKKNTTTTRKTIF
jgi:hypothetical protein